MVIRSGMASAAVAAAALGERDALVEAEQVARRGRSSTKTATLSMSRPSSSGMPSRASATSSSNRSAARSSITASRLPTRCHTPVRTFVRRGSERCSTGSTRPSGEAVTSDGRAPVHPGRGRLGQDPGAHPPHRLAVRRGRRRPPPRPGPHLHPQGGRRAAAPGCAASACATRWRPAPSTPSPTPSSASAGPTPGAAPPTLLDRKVRLLARLAAPAAGARPGLSRRRASPRSSGPRPGWSRPTRLRGGRQRPPAAGPAAAGGHGRPLRALRGGEAAPGLVDFDDLLWLCAATLRRRPRVRRRPALAVPPPVRRRVPGRQPRCSSGCSPAWRGDRADLCVVGDPNQADLRLERGRPRLPHRLHPALPRRRRRRGSTTTTGRRPRCWPSPTPCSTGGASVEPAACGPTGPTARCRASRSYPTDRTRPRAVARAVRDRHGARRPVVAAWPCWPAPTPSWRCCSRRRCGRPAVPYRVRGRAPFLDLPEIREAIAAARDARRRVRVRTRRPRRSAADPHDPSGRAGRGGTRVGSRGRRADAERPGSATSRRLLALADEYLAEPTRAGQRGGFVAWLAATHAIGGCRRRRRRRRPRHLPRGQGPRVAGRVPRRPRAGPGAHRSRQDDLRPRRRSAACSTSPSPAPSGS